MTGRPNSRAKGGAQLEAIADGVGAGSAGLDARRVKPGNPRVSAFSY